VAEIPAFEGWAAEHPEVDLILLSVDHPSAEPKVRAWLARHELPHLRSGLVADEASLARSVPGWNEMLPYTVVIAPSGEVTRKFTGAVSLEQLSIASREASGAVASGSGSD
jgi:hypothetical protein